MTAPPWLALKKKTKAVDVVASMDYECPNMIHLEKHVRFYRELLRSTEKVDLSLAHSGKEEVFGAYEDPADPANAQNGYTAYNVILVPLRGDSDPRLEFLLADGSVDTRAEYKNFQFLQHILDRRNQYMTPIGSKTATPSGSPMASRRSKPPMSLSIPPPPQRPRSTPPPPEAPWDSSKKQKM